MKLSKNLANIVNNNTVKLDKQKALDMVMETTGCSKKFAEITVTSLENINPLLREVVKDWINGDDIDFDYKGITLSNLCMVNHHSIIDAIFLMDSLMKKTDVDISKFKDKFVRTL